MIWLILGNCAAGDWAVMPASLHALHRVIPSYANAFQNTDGDFQITNLYAESPVAPEFIQLYLSAAQNRREIEVLLAVLAPYLAHALSVTPNFSGAFIDSGEQGLIILNEHGKTLFTCPQGRRLLFLSTHPQIAPHTVCRSDNYEIPLAVLRRLNNSRANFTKQAVAPLVVHHQNPWGKFVFCVYGLEQNDYSGNALIGVTVRRQEPLPLKLMRTMQTLGLTATQRQVGLLLSEGCTHGVIARRLGVRLSTATDHVRKIYTKLDVHSHEQLLHKFVPTR